MPPELNERPRDRYSSGELSDESVTVGSPTEYAEAAEVPEVVAYLAKFAAGIGLAAPVIVVVVLILGSCTLCALMMIAAGWNLF